jgi:hypothetical protein
VLKSHLEDVNREAVPAMMMPSGSGGWQDGYMAVRSGSLIFASAYKTVKRVADALAPLPTDDVPSDPDHQVIDLTGCSVAKRPAETDKAHFAFALTTPEVWPLPNLQPAYSPCVCRRAQA